MFRLSVVCVLACMGSVQSAPTAADRSRIPVESEQTRKRLVEAEQKLGAGKAADAADDLQRILDEAGDDLVSLDGKHLVPARRVAHRSLARLPAETLAAYRDRVDVPARKLLDQAKRDRDPRPLQILLARYFPARACEEALGLLGEFAFERGDFRTAEAHWRRLLADSPGEVVPFPDPRAESRPGVLARVVLAEIFQGDRVEAERDLARLGKEFPDASGRLAGKDGKYVEILRGLLASPPGLPPEPTPDGEWSSFAGSPGRSGKVTGRLPYYWPTRPTWKTPIPPDRVNPRNPTRSAEAVGFHPVVLDGTAYISDGVRILGFDVLTGKSRVAFDPRPAGAPGFPDPPMLPLEVDADFALTVAEGKLFARLGAVGIAGSPGEKSTSFLVALSPEGGKLVQKWRLPAPVQKGSAGVWEGAPIVAGGRVYAVLARFEGTRVMHSIMCYDDPPGRPVWSTEVSDTPVASLAENRARLELLTLAEGNLIFCPNSGAVVAVDAGTGKPAWAFRYPAPEWSPTHIAPRDISPPVSADGIVYIAPTDTDRIFALEAGTGRPLWETGPIHTDQLLGVTRGHLIATIAGPNRGIRGLDIRTGSHREPEGWATHDDPFLSSYGRGLVSDSLVLWPTKSGIFLLHPTDGTAARPPIPGPHGNLAFADGVLLVATPTEMWGYVADRRLLQKRKKALSQRPTDPPDAVRELGYALADAGRFREAEDAFAEAGGSAEASRRKAEWLADSAEWAILRGERDQALAVWRQILAGDFPRESRAHAAGRVLSVDPRAAIPPELLDAWILSPTGVPRQVRDLQAGSDRPAAVTVSFPSPPDTDLPAIPSLGPDSRIGSVTRFPTPGCVPLLPFPGQTDLPGMGGLIPVDARKLLVCDGRKLYAIRPGEEKPAWEVALPVGVRPTHASASENAILVAGPRGIAAFRFADGKRLWEVVVPETSPLPEREGRPVPRSHEVEPPFPDLCGFAVEGDRVVARLGGHHLIGFDLTSGRVAWVLDAAKRARFSPFASDPFPRISPGFALVGNRVVAQTSRGRRLGVTASTGTIRGDFDGTLARWDSPPAVLGNHRVAVADGPGVVRGIAVDLRLPEWTYDARGETSLTGRAPAVRKLGDILLAAFFRNHGIEVVRLLPATGRPAWGDRTAFLPAGDIDLSLADADASTVYLPAEGKLLAVRTEDGRELWTANLGPGLWRVRVARRVVLAYPEEPLPEEPIPLVISRILSRFAMAPDVGRLPLLALGVYDAWADRSLPILFLDAETGREKHRLTVPVGPVAAVHLGPEIAVVATVGKAIWLK